jgi:acetoin utilization deacetylase AcuC-like enzyme
MDKSRRICCSTGAAFVLWAVIPFNGKVTAIPRQSETARSGQTGFVYDPIYLQHLAGNTGHPERPERLTAILDGLDKAGVLKTVYRIVPRRSTDQELELVHSPAYVAIVQRELSNLHGLHELSTGDTLTSPGSLEAAHYAVGGVLNAVDAVMANQVRNAFCAVRPPGHHATPDRGMGFCIYNSVAIAARHLQKVYKVKRVLIVDWDYHHGNGTQDAFYDDGSVMYFSTHDYGFGVYPGTGSASETGRGAGSGKIVNVPLPKGAGNAEILQAFQTKLVPAARGFKPDFILISAGFDAMRNDLLGQFDVTPEGFAAITRVVVELAEELCKGRVVSVLEGGYRLDGLADSVTAHVRVLQEK